MCMAGKSLHVKSVMDRPFASMAFENKIAFLAVGCQFVNTTRKNTIALNAVGVVLAQNMEVFGNIVGSAQNTWNAQSHA